MVEPPYPIIRDGLASGRVVPFLGAGASLLGRPLNPEVAWQDALPPVLPTGRELATYLAHQTSFPEQDPAELSDLAKVSSYYAEMAGRSALRDKLRNLFSRQMSGGLLHEYLASIPAPLVIVVTNYDTLVEDAFRSVGKPYDLVVYSADQKEYKNSVIWWQHGKDPKHVDPKKLQIDLDKTSVIFKMHGTVFPGSAKLDNYVITEEDYVEFMSRMTVDTAIPRLFSPYFSERHFLFLGYSLRDWNLRVVLRNLRRYLLKSLHDDDVPAAWAIQYRPSSVERELWSRRKVKIFDMAIDDFIAKLRQT